MLARIRYISHKQSGTVIQSEKIDDRHVISIGRATDQDIFLPDACVSYQHARLTLSPDGNVGVSSLTKAGLYLDGRFVQSGSIERTGELTVGPYRIRVNNDVKIKHKDSFIRVDITYEKIAQGIVELEEEKHQPSEFKDSFFSKRALSWVAASIILVLFFVFPMVAHLNPEAGKFLNATAFLPGNSVWSSGELSLSHRRLSGECSACHIDAFTGINDYTCLECHSVVGVHANAKPKTADASKDARCSTCHLEHKGTDLITKTDEPLCINCHGNINDLYITQLTDISNFDAEHPQFRVLMSFRLAPPLDKQLITTFVSMDHSNARQINGIKFSHSLHVDGGGLPTAEGKRVLLCEDCHQKNINTGTMDPVSMEKNCQGCHQLRFDKNSPDRRLPHSEPDEMVVLLEEFYARQALQKNISSEKRALRWAKEKAEALRKAAKSDTACGKCHYITENARSEKKWGIDKINISRRWFARMKFSHDTHESQQCTDCHDAEASSSSEDVLIPRIEQCRQCHSSSQDGRKLITGCVDCHQYHHSQDAIGTVNKTASGTE